MDCLIKNEKMSPYLSSLLGIVFLPILISIIAGMFWFALSKVFYKKFRKTAKRNFICTVLTVCYMVYPIITSKAFEAFNCMEIEGTKYLVKDFELECWST